MGSLRKEDKKLDAIYVAGALQVWVDSAPNMWTRLKDNLGRFAKEPGGKRSVSPVADDVPRREYIWPSTWPDDERIVTSGRNGLSAGTTVV